MKWARLHVRPEFDRAVERGVKAHFDRYSSVSFENYPAMGHGTWNPELK